MSVLGRRRPRVHIYGRRFGRLPRPGPRMLLVLIVVAAVLVGAFFWVRQSSLVAVQRVTVTGVTGPDAAAIRATLVQAAERMTTMDVDDQQLRRAVARYPVVHGLRTTSHLPHGLTIAVVERIPVAILDAGGQRTTVSADGQLLRSVNPGSQVLPTISASAPADQTVSGTTRDVVTLLAAAPYPLLAKMATAGEARGHGLTVALRSGPTLYFGDTTNLAAKWRAVIAVLASPSTAGASYIDVTDPARPAAGGGSDSSVASGGAAPATSTATSGETSTPTGG